MKRLVTLNCKIMKVPNTSENAISTQEVLRFWVHLDASVTVNCCHNYSKNKQKIDKRTEQKLGECASLNTFFSVQLDSYLAVPVSLLSCLSDMKQNCTEAYQVQR